jgi:protein disulfide-isomerase
MAQNEFKEFFFVFDNKYAVSGAQHIETFVKTLEKVWEEGDFDSKLLY